MKSSLKKINFLLRVTRFKVNRTITRGLTPANYCLYIYKKKYVNIYSVKPLSKYPFQVYTILRISLLP